MRAKALSILEETVVASMYTLLVSAGSGCVSFQLNNIHQPSNAANSFPVNTFQLQLPIKNREY